MPELAEVEYYRKQWNPGFNHSIERIHLNQGKRIFRQDHATLLQQKLPGTVLTDSWASAKWMLFHFKPKAWLGIHLGMTGALSISSLDHLPKTHEHLVLYQKKQCLIFSDPRLFGRVLFHHGPQAPDWWQQLPPPLNSGKITLTDIQDFLTRHPRRPIKAVLLMQERFPGIGNWMADEILWRSLIHPRRQAATLRSAEVKKLWQKTLEVVEDALRVIGTDWSDPPDSWLFNHRWKDGGICPRSGGKLLRDTIGGRTTCWSPKRQKL
jgi:formamidopyrimidine-DNA glycosylase